MSAVAEARRLTGPTATAAPRSASNGWWGMVFLIATEATLFAVLLASYFYLRFKLPGAWPPDGIADPKLVRALAMTLILIASGVCAYVAETGIRRGDQRALVLGLTAVFVLGLVFLGLQAWETHVTAGEFTPRTDAYGSFFFTITGMHSAHLAVGLLLVAWVGVRALFGAYTPQRHLGVQMATVYWYFVVVVQIAIFTALYLSPRI